MATAIRIKPQAVRVKNVAKIQQRRRTKPFRRLMVGFVNGVLILALLVSSFIAPYVADALLAEPVSSSTTQQ